MVELRRLPADHAERAQCVDVRRSFIVQAPAGSGKTTLLTERFVALLCVVDAPSEIVAITFTRKAAAEMRERVLLALNKANMDDADDVAARAIRHHLATSQIDLRTSPERIRVMTFDRLFLFLARQAPLTSGIGPETAPVPNAQAYMRDAAMAALQMQPQQTETRVLLQHVDANLSQTVEAIAGLLATRDQWLHVVLDPDAASPEALRETVQRVVEAHLHVIRGVLVAEVPSAQIASVMDAARFALDTLGRDVTLPEAFPDASIDALLQWNALLFLIFTEKGEPKKRLTKSEGFPSEAKAEKAAFQAFLDGMKSAPKVLKAFSALRALPNVGDDPATWRQLASTFTLLRLAAAHLQLTLSDHQVTDFIAPAQAVVSALRDTESALPAFVAETMRHVLVDEFQDTSRTQFNFLRGVAHAWSQRGSGEETLFCVGDPMQSIYRFRQTDVALFARAKRDGIGGHRLHPITLTTNFRSTPEVVAWVNAAVGPQFAAQSTLFAEAVDYAASIAHDQTPQSNAAVHVQAYETPEDEIAAVVAYVKDWCARTPPDTTLGILVQAASHGEQITQALAEAGVRDVSAEALRKVTALSWLHDVLSLTYAFTEPEDRLSLLAVLRAPWCGVALPDLTAIAAALHAPKNDTALWAVLRSDALHASLSNDGRTRLAAFMDAIDPALRARGHRDPVRCVRAAWTRLEARAAYSVVIDADLFARVMACIRAQSQRGVVLDRAQLLSDLRDLRLPNAGDGRVQVMTVHKAKGLEFDAVILPLAAKRTKRDARPLVRFADFDDSALAVVRPQGEHDPAASVYDWLSAMQDKEALAERVRLLYVAATRAKSALLITGSKLFAASGAPASVAHTLWGALGHEISPESVQTSAGQSAPKVQTAPISLVRCETLAVMPLPPYVQMHPPTTLSLEREHARAFGVVAHAWLGAHGHRGAWGETAERWAAGAFAEQGQYGEAQRSGIAQLARMVTRVSTCRHAPVIWANDHRAAWNEWALAFRDLDRGEVCQLRPDRVYQTAAGDVWVIDFKTSEPADLDPLTVAAFIHVEKNAYAETMQRYADAVAATECFDELNIPIRRALYFPLLGELGVYED